MKTLRVLTILAPLVLLAACGDNNGRPVSSAVPDTPSDFSRPIYAQGANPSWSLTIRGTVLTLSRPNQADVVVQAPEAAIQPHQASWSGVMSDGRALKASLYASPCNDAVSGASRPFSAEVNLPDGVILVGCAYPIATATPAKP
ncbi:MAG TPA: hypothetical protein VHN73_03655 [Phenylobacterium sp.]|nr:hypothetical protein [Phenylobacterium sp.]